MVDDAHGVYSVGVRLVGREIDLGHETWVSRLRRTVTRGVLRLCWQVL